MFVSSWTLSAEEKKNGFFEPKTEYNKVLKINVKIPASGKNSSAVFFISSIKRYFLWWNNGLLYWELGFVKMMSSILFYRLSY